MRKRLILVTLAGVVPMTLFVQWSDMVVGGTAAAGPYPPLAACLVWALLLGILAGIRRLRGFELLTRGETLAVFGIWAAANMVAGRGMAHALVTSIAGPIYYARTGATSRAIHEHLPDWLALKDRGAATHLFEGYGLGVPWDSWRAPLLTWALFLIPLLVANVSLAALFETMWVRRERLAFPLVLLPITAMEPGANAREGPLRSVFLAGLAIPILLHSFGAIHAYVPAVPCLPFFNDVSYLAAAPPWTAIKPLYLNIYPYLIGVTFMAPTDVTLSVWFFLLVNKIELFAAASTGWSDGAQGGSAAAPPFLEEQSAGAFITLAAIIAWSARGHIASIVRSSFGRRDAHAATGSATSEQAGYRLPILAFCVSGIALLGWMAYSGMPVWFSAAYIGFYFAVALVLGRLMAESGIPWLLAPVLPDKLILSLTGTAALSQQALTRLTLHVQHLRDTRQMLGPAAMHAGRLREEGETPVAPFYALLFIALLLTLAAAIPSALTVLYHRGALALTTNSDGMMMTANVIPTTGINQLSSRLISPTGPSLSAGMAALAGAGFTLALSALRGRFLWWPLNPLGYALTGTMQAGYANKMFLSVLLGWVFKQLVLRFGGAAGFRLLRMAALGLIFGDLVMGGVLKALDAVLGPSGYGIF